MAAAVSPKLLGSIKKYIGYSTDTKSTTTQVGGSTPLPAGSTFFEIDKQRTATWDGYNWTYERQEKDSALADTLNVMISTLQQLNDTLELLMSKF